MRFRHFIRSGSAWYETHMNRADHCETDRSASYRQAAIAGEIPRVAAMFAGALIAAMTVVFAAAPASAQEEPQGTGYITPFPANDVYQMMVVGDTFAEGMVYGLVEAMGTDQRLVIQRKHRVISGIMTAEHDEHVRQLEETVNRDAPHIAVIMLGEDDRQPLRPQGGGKRIPVGAEEWRAEYGRRVDRVMKVLKKKGASVYWVGLPSMRRSDANEDAKMMNEIIRERGYLNGIKYIDAYAGFADEDGGYNAYGPDLTGKIRILREGDGINFTGAGNRKLAHFVERELNRDLTQAKSERSIPLAGSVAEQDKINQEKREAAAKEAARLQAEETARQNRSSGTKPATAAAGASAGPASSGGEQKADNGKINLRTIGASGREEIVQLEIVRPAIPASVVALVTRRESSDKPSQQGETLIDQIAGGMTVMSSVTPSGAGNQGGGRQRISPTQTPFFRVLVKGERLAPKPGRADDLAWPRPEPATTQPAAAAPVPPAPTRATAPSKSKDGKDAAKDVLKDSSKPPAPKDQGRQPKG